MSMEYLKERPIAVIGGGAVGKTIAADCKLAVGDAQEVRLFDAMPFAATTLKNLDKTGIELVGPQTNRDGFYRGGKAYLDMYTSDMAEAVKGAGIIVVAMGAFGHEPTFKNLVPLLEDGQVVHIFTDNYGTLLLRKMMRDMGSTADIIVGSWSSAPYGTRVKMLGKVMYPQVRASYRAITLRGAALPMKDWDKFEESTKYLPCLDAVTNGEGPAKGNTVLDIGFSNINPVIHVPASILGLSTMENWGVIFGGYDHRTYSMYSHGLCPSICEVQYQFYQEEIAIANAIGVDVPKYKYKSFFSRRSVLTQEYMGLDENGDDNVVFPLDQPCDEGNIGPDSIYHRYITEDVPVGCKIYHDLGVAYGVPTPIIDSMIILAGAVHKKSWFETSKYNLAYLGIDNMSKEELLAYLNEGVYNR
ncbi:MAG: NAD/NADP octopine/nopaline dehydrogenase family protein [Lachnospiraceae bacterium]|nr:NAD/NADP octopine/nopaline dehydrogenase family protein [Lachnospiraceae bacterium]